MDWEAALRRQALAEWRDRQILAISGEFNGRAAEALAAFDAQVTSANLIDSVWDPAGFANGRIDQLLSQSVPAPLDKALKLAGKELAAISPAFAELAGALAWSEAITFPESATAEPADAPAPSTVAAEPSWRIASVPLVRRALDAGQWAAETLRDAGVSAERALQDRTGLYDRLRSAAQARIATTWMGSAGEPRPVMQQVIDLIDDVSLEARTRLA